MDPMCPLPQKGDIHGLIVIVCCSHKLLNFAPYMKETSVSWVIQTCHALFAVWGRGWCNSVVYFSRGTLPTKQKGEKGHLAGGPRKQKKTAFRHDI